MLTAPYNFIYQDDNNKFYIITVEDELYLATESVLPMEDDAELQQGLKILHLDIPTIMLLNVFAKSPIETSDPDGLQNYYATLNPDLFKERLDNMLVKLKDEDYKDLFYTATNDTDFLSYFAASDVLAGEGNPVLWFTVDKLKRHHIWHIGLNPYGNLVLFVLSYVKVGDGDFDYNIYDMNRFVYGIDAVKAIVDNIFPTATADQPKEDLQ